MRLLKTVSNRFYFRNKQQQQKRWIKKVIFDFAKNNKTIKKSFPKNCAIKLQIPVNAVSLAKISVQTKICTTLFREIIISPVEMRVMLRSALDPTRWRWSREVARSGYTFTFETINERAKQVVCGFCVISIAYLHTEVTSRSRKRWRKVGKFWPIFLRDLMSLRGWRWIL